MTLHEPRIRILANFPLLEDNSVRIGQLIMCCRVDEMRQTFPNPRWLSRPSSSLTRWSLKVSTVKVQFAYAGDPLDIAHKSNKNNALWRINSSRDEIRSDGVPQRKENGGFIHLKLMEGIPIEGCCSRCELASGTVRSGHHCRLLLKSIVGSVRPSAFQPSECGALIRGLSIS